MSPSSLRELLRGHKHKAQRRHQRRASHRPPSRPAAPRGAVSTAPQLGWHLPRRHLRQGGAGGRTPHLRAMGLLHGTITSRQPLPKRSSLTSLAAFSPSSRRFLSIILLLSTAALSSALNVQPMLGRGLVLLLREKRSERAVGLLARGRRRGAEGRRWGVSVSDLFLLPSLPHLKRNGGAGTRHPVYLTHKQAEGSGRLSLKPAPR